jgi:hypothetical protein
LEQETVHQQVHRKEIMVVLQQFQEDLEKVEVVVQLLSELGL